MALTRSWNQQREQHIAACYSGQSRWSWADTVLDWLNMSICGWGRQWSDAQRDQWTLPICLNVWIWSYSMFGEHACHRKLKSIVINKDPSDMQITSRPTSRSLFPSMSHLSVTACLARSSLWCFLFVCRHNCHKQDQPRLLNFLRFWNTTIFWKYVSCNSELKRDTYH